MPVRNDEDGAELLLTAAHVVGALAPNWRALVPVYTSWKDVPSAAMQDRVGNTVRSVPSAVVTAVPVDAAVVGRLRQQILCGRGGGHGALRREVRECAEDDIGLVLYKQGHATGLTKGLLYEVETEVSMTHCGHTLYYRSVLTVMPENGDYFSKPGDSGAIVRDEDNRVVGLVIGMEDPGEVQTPLTFCTPIQPALDALNVHL
jgi:hypothetical protein